MALKIGAEDKKKVAILGALGVGLVAAAVWAWINVYPMFGGGTPAPPPPATVTRVTPGPAVEATHEAAKVSGSLASLDPTLHPEWMAAAESMVYAGNGRNIFSMSSAPVEIETPQAPARPEPAVAQGPPPPPPIDLKFFGYAARAGGERQAFLLHGDDVFIASTGDVVDHRYKIMQIAPLSIQVEDIPYNNTQTLPLIQN